MLERILNFFIPEELLEPLGSYYRSRILVTISLVGGSVLMPFAISRFLLQAWHPYPFVLSLVIVGIFASPWILRSSRSVNTAGFTVMSIFDGGIASPTVFGLVIIPILSIFFGTLLSGVVVALLTATSILLIAVGTQFDLMVNSSIPPDTQIYLTAGSAVALMCVLMSLCYLFVEWQAVARERLTAANIACSD